MAKEKKRNYDEKTKGEVLSEETRNALLGILVFLIAVIGLVETAGPLGKIIRYIFVYLLGTFSSLVLLTLSLVGIYIFIKRKRVCDCLHFFYNLFLLCVFLFFSRLEILAPSMGQTSITAISTVFITDESSFDKSIETDIP